MDLRLRFFTQWSQVEDKWHCIACRAIAKGVEDYRYNKKGKRKKFYRQEHSSILHTLEDGDGNRLVHEKTCKFFVEYLAALPSASAMVS